MSPLSYNNEWILCKRASCSVRKEDVKTFIWNPFLMGRLLSHVHEYLQNYDATNPSLQQCNKEAKTPNYTDKKREKTKRKYHPGHCWQCTMTEKWIVCDSGLEFWSNLSIRLTQKACRCSSNLQLSCSLRHDTTFIDSDCWCSWTKDQIDSPKRNKKELGCFLFTGGKKQCSSLISWPRILNLFRV